MLKLLCLIALAILNTKVFAEVPETQFITLGNDALEKSKSIFGKNLNLVKSNDYASIVEVQDYTVAYLSKLMHEEFKRCSGFIAHDSLEEAQAFLSPSAPEFVAPNLYTINRQSEVPRYLAAVESKNIANVIKQLSNFQNRFYTSDHGVKSSRWLADLWGNLTEHRSDASIELYKHKRWPQESVILTIKGQSDETVVVGGHADSISGFFGGKNVRAPGADDNASGIATITEVIRVLMKKNYRPQKTLKFMGYAAEEVGLRGSKEIAADYKRRGEKVVGVIQLDMTNFNGSADIDMVLIDDFTNAEQNKFLAGLIDQYLPKIRWTYDSCGYACSDHASWHQQGFPASTPFEAQKNDMNRNIHTPRDTIDLSGGHARHAGPFAQLALAYVLEIDK